MIFSADREEFAAAVARAAQGLPLHPLLPVHAGMLVRASAGQLELTCSDGEVTFTVGCPADILAEEGAVILPGKVLDGICRYLVGDQVRVDACGSTAKITARKAEFTLPCAPGDTYPAWQVPDADAGTADAAALAAAVRTLASLPLRGDPVLRAVNLVAGEKLTLAATNRSALGVFTLDWNPAPFFPGNPPRVDCLVPAGMLDRVIRGAEGEITLSWDERLFSAQAQGLRVTSRQLAGKFPRWRQVLEAAPPVLGTVMTAELIRTARMAGVITGDAAVRLSFTPAGAELSAQTAQGMISAELDYQGEPASAWFLLGAQLLADVLAGCGEQAGFSFAGSGQPLFFHGDHVLLAVQPRRELEGEDDGQS